MRISDWSSDVCSSDLVPGTQAKFAYLIGRYINIVRASKIIGFRTAQKTKAVGQDLNGAKAHDLLAIFGFHLQDREHEILFAKSRSPFHPQLLRHGDEFGGRFLLEVFQMHQCRSGKGMLRKLPLYAFLGKEFSCADGREGGQRYAAPDL